MFRQVEGYTRYLVMVEYLDEGLPTNYRYVNVPYSRSQGLLDYITGVIYKDLLEGHSKSRVEFFILCDGFTYVGDSDVGDSDV